MANVNEPRDAGVDTAPASSSSPAPSWEGILREIEKCRSGWAEALEGFNDAHRAGHERLRLDIQGQRSTIENNYRHFDDMDKLTRARLGTLEAVADRPVDATKLVLSTRAIVSVVVAALAIAGSYWNLSTKLDAQQRLTDLQIVSLQETIRQTSARYELLRIEVQSLKETVIQGKATK